MYKNAKENNKGKESKVLVVFDDKIAVMIGNKKFNSIVTGLLIRRRKKIFHLFLLRNHTLKNLKMFEKLYTLLYYENTK